MSEDSTKKTPTHTAYSVREFKDQQGKTDSTWLKLGVAWEHGDGEGMNIMLDAVPVSGRLVIRKNKAEDETKSGSREDAKRTRR